MLTRYVTSFDGAAIAVTVRGDAASLPLMCVSSWATTPTTEAHEFSTFDELAAQRLVVTYDRRGTGASGPEAVDLGLEAQVRDLAAIGDALALDVFDIFASFDGTPIAIAHAARIPERVRKLVLLSPLVRGSDSIPPDRVRGLIDLARTDWPLALRTTASLWGQRDSTEGQRATARRLRGRLTPDVFARSLQAVLEADVTEEARCVQAETLILHTADAGFSLRQAQRVASLIPHSVLQSVDAVNTELVPAIILRFLDGAAEEARSVSQATAIILFADIVDSTQLTEQMGDKAFRAGARDLDGELRRIITESGGTTIDAKTLGDGVLATFPSASQAIEAALAFERAADGVRLQLHVGIHAGDVIREEGNVFGGAVNIAARISALSAPGEVLVSDTVRSLARTSAGVTFEDRGEHALKGVADPQRVYAVRKDDV
jgi:class 3 adenylate cyclase